MTKVQPASSSASGPARQELPGRGPEAGRRTDVLVVEDEPDLREVTSFVLESEGFRVETAKDGQEALERLRAGELPAVVLLDMAMPVMNGREFLDAIAQIPSLQTLPIVALTAAGLSEVPGTVTALCKPIDLALLIETVARHARRGGGSPA